ncbi:uncharacterized protein LOC107783472 [Nicotiana tabacum]|uniref:Uncharacterized protein LOC107783472 n=1 Tax=Nicotiana tabacum TaxID=4097 RepID=A0AC58TQC8_TOBAC
MEDVKEEIEYWQTAVVCFVLESNPPLTVVEGYFNRIWKDLGIDKVAQINKRVFMVRFHSNERRTKAIEGGVQIFDRKPVIIKPWKPGTEIMNVTVEQADTTTTRKEKLMYARVMVEVPLNKAYLDSVMFENELGQIIEQEIEYEWKPTMCQQCKLFGHTDQQCRRVQQKPRAEQVRKEWKPVERNEQKEKPSIAGESMEQKPKNVQRKALQKQIIMTVSNSFSTLEDHGEEQIAEESAREKTMTDRRNKAKGIIQGEGTHQKKRQLNSKLPEGSTKARQAEMNLFLHNTKVGLFGFLDTKIKRQKTSLASLNLCNGWSFSHNLAHHPGGRIWVLWKTNIFSVNITDVSAQMMHCEVEHRGTQHKFQIIFVYGFNDQALRRQLWQELEKIHGVTKKPWAVMGDFNCVLNRDKRVGSPITVSEIKEFKECVGRCSLQELKSSGSFLTWNNKHGDNSRVHNRIDKVLVNGDWVMKLPGSEVHFGNEGLMDHCPALINWDQGPQSG